MTRPACLLALGLVALGSLFGSARAATLGPSSPDATVLLSESLLTQTSTPVTASLAVPGAGELFVTLTDLDFPTPFASLQYAVSNVSGTMMGLENAGAMTTLDLTAPVTMYANIFPTLGGSAGLFNLTATFVPTSTVSLPSSAASLIGGALLLVWLLSERNRGRLERERAQHGSVTSSMA